MKVGVASDLNQSVRCFFHPGFVTLYRHVGDNSIFPKECCSVLDLSDISSPHFRRKNVFSLREKATSGPLLAKYICSFHGQQPATLMRETPLISGTQICEPGISAPLRVSSLCHHVRWLLRSLKAQY